MTVHIGVYLAHDCVHTSVTVCSGCDDVYTHL